jgi:two-component system sensor histidine kinase YesM
MRYGGLFRIRRRYILLVLFSVLVFVASGALILDVMSDGARRDAGEYALANLRSVAAVVDEFARNAEYVLTPILGDPAFASLARDLGFMKPVASYPDYQRMKRLEEVFRSNYIGSRSVSSISYYDFGADLMLDASSYLHVLPQADVRASAWYRNYARAGAGAVWTLGSLPGSGEAVLSSYREVRRFDGGWIDAGVLSVNIKQAEIVDIVRRITRDMTGSMAVIDVLGQVVAAAGAAGPEAAGAVLAAVAAAPAGEARPVEPEAGRFLAVRFDSEATGLRFVGLLAYRDVGSFLPLVSAYIGFSYLALFLALGFLAFSAYRNFYSPLRRLSDGMQEVAAGDFSVRIPAVRKDEIGPVFEAFNDMAAKLKRLIDDNYVIELQRRDARMKMMLSQMNEHFLYNTLDCIHWLARKHGVAEIADVVFALSRFYSLSLSDGRDEVRVAEAAEIIGNYLDILLVRKPDDFAYSCAVDEAVRDLYVLKYLFQPLVENAFIHGVSELEAPGCIEVSFRAEDGRLRFAVRDNGRGMPAERLAELRAVLARGPAAEGEAFALRLVDSQIKLFYGQDYGLRIDSREGEGTTAAIELPLAALADRHV